MHLDRSTSRGGASERRWEDQRIEWHGVTWSEYEALLAIRGDRPGTRITYREGELEIRSPSAEHSATKKMLARLIEAYADERGTDLNSYGTWTVRSAPKACGIEADECYVLGTHRPAVPDLAIEVAWTSGGIDKLDVYAGLGVREVWVWEDERLRVFILGESAYQVRERSALLPDLDIELVASYVGRDNHVEAVRDYRRALRQP